MIVFHGCQGTTFASLGSGNAGGGLVASKRRPKEEIGAKVVEREEHGKGLLVSESRLVRKAMTEEIWEERHHGFAIIRVGGK